MMVLREIFRRPLRTLASSLGIAGAVALLILGRFGWDSINSYFEEPSGENSARISVSFLEPRRSSRGRGALPSAGYTPARVSARSSVRARIPAIAHATSF